MNKQFANGRKFAIITATQERLGAYNSASNIAATLRLRRYLTDSRVHFIVVEGWYNGIEQGPSFLVWDISEDAALFIAREAKQESIITERGLVFVDGARLVPAVRYLVGDAAKATGNYTEMPDGLCWSFVLEGMSDDAGGQVCPVVSAPAPFKMLQHSKDTEGRPIVLINGLVYQHQQAVQLRDELNRLIP